jgi:hypothetical protein
MFENRGRGADTVCRSPNRNRTFTGHNGAAKAAKGTRVKAHLSLPPSLLPVLLLAGLLAAVLPAESGAWPWSKRKVIVPLYEFSSGWKIMKMVPADETRRVSGFEAAFGDCPNCRETMYEYGNFLLYREMRKVNYENWWSVAIDIPLNQFLRISRNSKVVLTAVTTRGDTISVESRCIAFARGWTRDYKRALQHTVYYNTDGDFQVTSSQNPTRNDFEWTDFGNDRGRKYVVGYVYFGEDHNKMKMIGFRFEGIDSYPLSSD